MGNHKKREQRKLAKKKRQVSRSESPENVLAQASSLSGPVEPFIPLVNSTWKMKLASKEQCVDIGFLYTPWIRILSYLMPREQIRLQLKSPWFYQTGVPRAMMTHIPLRQAFYFPCDAKLLTLETGRWSSKVTSLDADISSRRWSSVQVHQHIFQVFIRSEQCRLLFNLRNSEFRAIEKAPMIDERSAYSLCSMQSRFIFATGGYNSRVGLMSSVERYDLTKNVWEKMPSLNVARFDHSSCTLGATVYVVCGANKKDINSIEKLETQEMKAGWQLIQMPPTSLLTPRTYPVVTALNENEILIMGGIKKNFEYSGDAFIFETRDNSVKQTIQRTTFKFDAFGGSSQAVRPGVVVALVQDYHDRKFKLIEYRNDTIRVLHTIRRK